MLNFPMTFIPILLLCACDPPIPKPKIERDSDESVFVPSPGTEMIAFDVLKRLNTASISDSVEICTYIVRAPNAEIGILEPKVGVVDQCVTPIVRKPLQIIALLHTHGSVSDKWETEIPSILDVRAIEADMVDGYLSTPGGRFWHMDIEERETRMLCGPSNCLSKDDAYIADEFDNDIKTIIRFEDLGEYREMLRLKSTSKD